MGIKYPPKTWISEVSCSNQKNGSTWRSKKRSRAPVSFRIVNITEKHDIPKSIVLNSDQTSSKYASVGRATMTPKNSTRVGLAGSTKKSSITLTLTLTFDEKTLPFHINYGGKTDQWLPKVIFTAKFSTSVNEKHYNNTEEVMNCL